MRRILFLSNSKTDGAGTAASRIADCMKASETIEIIFLDINQFHEQVKPTSSFLQKIVSKVFFKIFSKRAFAVKKGFDFFSNPQLPFYTSFSKIKYENYDAIHLHWVANQIDFPSFFASIPSQMPVFWSLHDMNPFTGGCHYTWDCKKFEHGCSNCPQLPEDKWFDLASHNFRIKRKAYNSKNIFLLPNSRWTEEQVAKSALLKDFPRQLMKYPIDTEVFYPVDKKQAKKELNLLTDNTFYISFGAIHLENKRKGLSELVKALQLLNTKGLLIRALVFGGNFDPLLFTGLPEVTSFGRISDPDTLRFIYSASDVFIISSLQEAFGQTCLEAMACGTTPVGFEGTGVADMITNDETGLLCESGNYVQLADRIEYLYNSKCENARLAKNATSFVKSNFDSQLISKHYEAFYLEHL